MAGHVVVVPPSTDLNRGDQALVVESIKLCRDSGLTGHYYFLQPDYRDVLDGDLVSQSRREGYAFLPPVLRHPGSTTSHVKGEWRYSTRTVLGWGRRALWDLAESSVALVLSARGGRRWFHHRDERVARSIDAIASAEAVVVKGGGFLHTYGEPWAWYYAYFMLYHLRLALHYGVPVIVMPNSYGPFLGFGAKPQMRSVLSRCRVLSARESISSKVLSEVVGRPVPTYPDLGFFLEKRLAKIRRSSGTGVFDFSSSVAITVRPYRFPGTQAPRRQYRNYVASFAGFIGWLVRNGFHPVLVAHTIGPGAHEDDRVAIKDILQWVPTNVSVLDEPSWRAEELKWIYRQFDFLVGTRFHSVIFALSEGVPSIAVSYGGNKARGIMRDMGLEEYVVPIEAISTDILVERFISLSNKADHVKQIAARFLDRAWTDRKQFVDEIKRQFAT